MCVCVHTPGLVWACILPMGLYIDSGTGFSQVGVPNYPRLKIPLSGEYCPDSKLELLYCRVPSLVPKLYTVLGEIRTCVIVGDVATCLTWSKQSTGFWSWIMLLALRKYCSSVSDGQLGTFHTVHIVRFNVESCVICDSLSVLCPQIIRLGRYFHLKKNDPRTVLIISQEAKTTSRISEISREHKRTIWKCLCIFCVFWPWFLGSHPKGLRSPARSSSSWINLDRHRHTHVYILCITLKVRSSALCNCVQ